MMVKLAVGAVCGIAALAALAGCSGSAANRNGQHQASAAKVAHSAPASVSPKMTVTAGNERRFAYWLAGAFPDPASVDSAVSGSVMQDYAQFQGLLAEADAASGSPGTPEAVSAVSGGYRLCGTTTDGGTSCDVFSGFRTNASGRITDVAVNGQPISTRLAAGPAETGSQLAISDVLAYRLGSIGQVVVTYKALNITNHVVGNGNPAFLAYFDPSSGGQFQEDDHNSTLPSNLQPGESAVEYAAFATQTVTGQFSLRSNDGYTAVLASSTVEMPGSPSPHSSTAAQQPAPSAVPTVSFSCKVLQTAPGQEEFSIITNGGASYAGTVNVSFAGPSNSSDIFPGTTVGGATPLATWHQVPAADIGASAEPFSCTASAG